MERHVRVQDIDSNDIFEIIDRAGLKPTVLPIRKYKKNVILEFHSNLSITIFDVSSPDQFKAYIRGQYITISPAVIDQLLERPTAAYTEVLVSLNVVARN